eukprot:80646-Pyramimonas_sp.AAC.1
MQSDPPTLSTPTPSSRPLEAVAAACAPGFGLPASSVQPSTNDHSCPGSPLRVAECGGVLLRLGASAGLFAQLPLLPEAPEGQAGASRFSAPVRAWPIGCQPFLFGGSKSGSRGHDTAEVCVLAIASGMWPL